MAPVQLVKKGNTQFSFLAGSKGGDTKSKKSPNLVYDRHKLSQAFLKPLPGISKGRGEEELPFIEFSLWMNHLQVKKLRLSEGM